ncbi:MAG TPA: hypothetical protein VFR48_01265 [Solirubrobacteraceae bacterium]|nr:hypothetical protein [Solirubrobacteraceae bacterium]
MKPAAIAVALSCLCAVAGCGEGAVRRHETAAHSGSGQVAEGTSTIITTRTIPPGQGVRGDGDVDNPHDYDGNGDIDVKTAPGAPKTIFDDGDADGPTRESYRYPDADDAQVLGQGRPPSPSVRREIATVVSKFYSAAVQQDGAAACAMLAPSLARTVVGTYGGAAGPVYMRGSTCKVVMTRLFTHAHAELVAPVQILAVRVSGHRANAMVGSRAMRASYIALESVGRRWVVSQLLGEPLP